MSTSRVPSTPLFSDSPSRQVFTVSQLTGLVRASLERDFAEVWLEGEISNLRAPGSGHLYCTLKDDSSQIRAVIFRPTALRLRFGLEDGLHVIVRGRVTVYEPRGEYQIILEYLEPQGRGAQQLALEQLKNRLAAEGLFDQGRKKPLPAFPRTVGIVTSLSGAAVRDMMTVLHRRCPILHLILAPVLVQGDGSAEQIVAAIRSLTAMGHVDVIIVGRGGGSSEDLWSFNDERVVRAIAESPVPIVSAVGHETDVTMADFAADVRAPTPSAAAEAVAPVLSEVLDRLGELTMRSRRAIRRHCEGTRSQLDLLVSYLANVRFQVLEDMQQVDGAVIRMCQAMQELVKQGWDQLHAFQHVLIGRSPAAQVRHGTTLVPQLLSRLQQVMRFGMDRRTQEAHACLARLHALSPLAILDRGYSIVETVPARRIVRAASQVLAGQEVVARLSRGQLRCTVNETVPEGSV
ncbi:MAG: exodeoxyribonuclease VII large subunit [Nitrospira sp.]|nr:exodeoxyribonuclease VII large subunit [Nitrospira sp.]